MSVVVPCFNYGRFLPECVNSVLSQESVDVDVIIVDDASTDDSAAVARKIADADPRVRLVARPHNGGPVATYNDGLALCTGEFIVRLDADDLLTPGSLKRAVALFAQLPTVGLVYGHPKSFVGDAPMTARTRVRRWVVWRGVDWLALRCRLTVNCITAPEVVLRGDIARALGGQLPQLARTHDMEMWLRVAAVSDVAHIDGPDQAFHREHPQSLSNGYGPLEELFARRETFLAMLDGPAGRLPESAELRVAAMRGLAMDALDRACRAYDRRRVEVDDVDGFVAFALSTYDRVRELPQWCDLNRRLRVGSTLAPVVPQFFMRAITRRVVEERDRRRWRVSGI